MSAQFPAVRVHSAAARRAVALTIMLGTTSVILATTIVNVVLPDIMRDFAVGQGRVQWLATGFLSAMAATMLSTAWWVRAYGLRRTYGVALAVFVIVSLVGGLSTSIDALILSRIVQGAVAGVIQPLAMIALFEVYPAEERGSAMAAYGLGVVLSPAIGPALGGLLGEVFGWRAVFFVTLPLCLAGLALAPKTLACFEKEAEPRPAFDTLGFLLLCAFLLFVLGGLAHAQRAGLSVVGLATAVVGTLVCGAAFVAWEVRHRSPMFDPRVFRNPVFAAASVVGFAYGMGLYGSTFLVPIFVQTISGFSVLEAGLLLLPGGMLLALCIPPAGRLTDKHSPHLIVCAGLACFALSFLLFAHSSARTGFWTLALWIALGRLGLALMIPALNAGAVQGLPAWQIAQGAGALNFVRQLGGAFGTSVLSLLLQWRLGVHQHDIAEAVDTAAAALEAATLAFDDSFVAVALVFLSALWPGWYIRRAAAQ
ncbi:MAG: DHA2 family efflux MFS transporter permease subunit [Rhodocyclaceae bacterium]|nr:DHA2 family efflux MFS transporter permease subunit [Rhodocyclaceae bacterium]